ncbi:DUF7504 family protein [Natronomonas sp. EA1]|uniref:DUF7504 family protein n=1 Tax=Natronomonas sp. EA1 TaxID=3421655 RepID=UPI003EBEA6E3
MGQGASETATFTQALASLKRTGSNILLVGAAGDAQHGACSRLLGDESEAPRERLLVSVGATAVDERIQDGTTVIEYEQETRSAAASASPAADSGPEPARYQTVTDLASLGREMEAAITEATRRPGGLEPAQLRVCVDSLRPLLEEHGEEPTFHFLHGITREIEAARGMGHFHLPVSYDDSAVRTLVPLFDAVIEVRTRGDGREQRWHLREAGLVTDWLPL